MANVQYDCTMQEGQIGDDVRENLVSGLGGVTTAVLGKDADVTEIAFTDIPNGFGFRGGELSTTSLVRGSVEGGLEQPVRVELMRAICDMWMEVTGCTVDELVVSVRDA